MTQQRRALELSRSNWERATEYALEISQIEYIKELDCQPVSKEKDYTVFRISFGDLYGDKVADIHVAQLNRNRKVGEIRQPCKFYRLDLTERILNDIIFTALFGLTIECSELTNPLDMLTSSHMSVTVKQYGLPIAEITISVAYWTEGLSLYYTRVNVISPFHIKQPNGRIIAVHKLPSSKILYELLMKYKNDHMTTPRDQLDWRLTSPYDTAFASYETTYEDANSDSEVQCRIILHVDGQQAIVSWSVDGSPVETQYTSWYGLNY